jgi:hypothetical protein
MPRAQNDEIPVITEVVDDAPPHTDEDAPEYPVSIHKPPSEVVETRSAGSPFDLPVEAFQSALDRRKANRKVFIKWVQDDLVPGTDFGIIETKRGPSKPSLWKPGAEKILGMIGAEAHFPNAASYEKAAVEGMPFEFIVLRCEIRVNGQVISTGMGAREVAKEYGDLNKAIKMAKKSALIDAVLLAFGLSEVFTQDLEDMDPEKLDPAVPPASEQGTDKRTLIEYVEGTCKCQSALIRRHTTEKRENGKIVKASRAYITCELNDRAFRKEPGAVEELLAIEATNPGIKGNHTWKWEKS